MGHRVAEANKDLFPQNASERSEDAEKKVLGHVCLSKEAHGDQDDISSTTGLSIKNLKQHKNLYLNLNTPTLVYLIAEQDILREQDGNLQEKVK